MNIFTRPMFVLAILRLTKKTKLTLFVSQKERKYDLEKMHVDFFFCGGLKIYTHMF